MFARRCSPQQHLHPRSHEDHKIGSSKPQPWTAEALLPLSPGSPLPSATPQRPSLISPSFRKPPKSPSHLAPHEVTNTSFTPTSTSIAAAA